MTTALPQPLVRVVRGHLSDDELAALTAVLLARATDPGQAGSSTSQPPNWQRPERTGAYRTPHSWRR